MFLTPHPVWIPLPSHSTRAPCCRERSTVGWRPRVCATVCRCSRNGPASSGLHHPTGSDACECGNCSWRRDRDTAWETTRQPRANNLNNEVNSTPTNGSGRGTPHPHMYIYIHSIFMRFDHDPSITYARGRGQRENQNYCSCMLVACARLL